VQIGDEGVTLSTLKPMGKAEFHNKTFEVKTAGNYIDRGERVKIIFIESHQIVVEPIN
jgi:membrane-bound ClpP family serine protease